MNTGIAMAGGNRRTDSGTPRGAGQSGDRNPGIALRESC